MLPKAGGLEDQPAGLVSRMAIVENVYDAQKALRGATDFVKFKAKNPDAWRIIEKIIELRKEAARYAE